MCPAAIMGATLLIGLQDMGCVLWEALDMHSFDIMNTFLGTLDTRVD